MKIVTHQNLPLLQDLEKISTKSVNSLADKIYLLTLSLSFNSQSIHSHKNRNPAPTDVFIVKIHLWTCSHQQTKLLPISSYSFLAKNQCSHNLLNQSERDCSVTTNSYRSHWLVSPPMFCNRNRGALPSSGHIYEYHICCFCVFCVPVRDSIAKANVT